MIDSVQRRLSVARENLKITTRQLVEDINSPILMDNMHYWEDQVCTLVDELERLQEEYENFKFLGI
jgi:hypothetical protein